MVIGGGHFGSYHARRLLRAVRAGRLDAPVAIVDRDRGCAAFSEFASEPLARLVPGDWLEFLRGWLRRAAASDVLIPAPLAPHLLWQWLAGELGAEAVAAPADWGLPFEMAGAGLDRYLSAAGWMCPATCVEPAHCPALHAPRDWDLAGIIEAGARERGLEAAVFRVEQVAEGIAGVAAGDLLDARSRLAGGAPGKVAVVATASHCHAAIGALRLG